MKKKVAIATLYANNNFGNKLQNYAAQEIIKEVTGFSVYTIVNYYEKYKIIKVLKDFFKYILHHKDYTPKDLKREKNFKIFDRNINKGKLATSYRYPNKKLDNIYDYFLVGSDQVWNQTTGRINDLFLLNFVGNSQKKISFSASLGTDKLFTESENQVKKYISDFYSISVREESAKKIVGNITGREDVEVLLDPTMSLDIEKWDRVSKRPKQFDEKNFDGIKFILLYFLGEYTNERKLVIEQFAQDNNCSIINVLDKDDDFYNCGPSEFIWLEKNAFLVCTDSFHSSVFAILYKTPFIVFNRDDGQKGINEMNSRIDTLLKKFELTNNYYNGKIDIDIISKDYSYVDKILEEEKKKTKKFIKRSFDL